jgi:hypothetical protein
MAKVIVPTGNEQMAYLKVDAKHAGRIVRADLLVKANEWGHEAAATRLR